LAPSTYMKLARRIERVGLIFGYPTKEHSVSAQILLFAAGRIEADGHVIEPFGAVFKCQKVPNETGHYRIEFTSACPKRYALVATVHGARDVPVFCQVLPGGTGNGDEYSVFDVFVRELREVQFPGAVVACRFDHADSAFSFAVVARFA